MGGLFYAVRSGKVNNPLVTSCSHLCTSNKLVIIQFLNWVFFLTALVSSFSVG
jgi:hypothetical protein